MNIKDFKAGTFKKGYEYQYFLPEKINSSDFSPACGCVRRTGVDGVREFKTGSDLFHSSILSWAWDEGLYKVHPLNPPPAGDTGLRQ